MKSFDRYIINFQKTINQLPSIKKNDIQFEKRGEHALIIKCELLFKDDSKLVIMEYLIVSEKLIKLTYSYHYQDSDSKLIFRYDNTGHHKHIPTYPNHKHVPSGVIPSIEISLNKVLEEIYRITNFF